jgi:FAD/FMN-containing dehydrogenase
MSELLDKLERELGAEAIIRDPDAVSRALRDNSWLSPILAEHFGQMGGGGPGIVADAVVAPADVDQLKTIISLAVRHDTPMTLRGGGTTNFGQSIPLEGGIVVDIRRLDRVIEVGETSITTEAGTLQGTADEAAREHGRELTLLPTTYASATMAGWVGGGHLGLGSMTHGSIWDGNVIKVKLLTAEDPPREIVLEGADCYPVLRTYGTTGVMTEVTLPTQPARRWMEAVVVFDTFAAAAGFVDVLAARGDIWQRTTSAQEAPIPTCFGPIKSMYRDDQAIAPLIVDGAHESDVRALAVEHGGTFNFWKWTGQGARFPLGYMSFGHRMLWVKKIAPGAAFLNCYFSPSDYMAQFATLRERFGQDIWFEHKLIRSGWLRRLRGSNGNEPMPSPLITIVPGDRTYVEQVMRFCDSIDVGYQNPHTFSIEESGTFVDFEPIRRFARMVDPKGLLNPGKLDGTFFSNASQKAKVAR